MPLLNLLFSLFALAVAFAASPAWAVPSDRRAHQPANVVARAPMPIPSIANIDPETKELFKRDGQADKLWVYGMFKTKKKSDQTTSMTAEFNETAGSSWCNEIDDVGSGSSRDNFLNSVHVDSHVGWTDPGPEDRPPEYVCFFYTSRGKCDPSDGHAEYAESVPGPKFSTNEVQFDTEKYKYISWGCQWHPKNMDCQAKGRTGHAPGKTC